MVIGNKSSNLFEIKRKAFAWDKTLTNKQGSVIVKNGSLVRSQCVEDSMLFAITSTCPISGKRVVAIQEGLSRKSVFDGLEPILERIAKKLGEKFYMKNWETWGIDSTHFSVEPVNKVGTEEELEQYLLRVF